jgi:hypothetical protein
MAQRKLTPEVIKQLQNAPTRELYQPHQESEQITQNEKPLINLYALSSGMVLPNGFFLGEQLREYHGGESVYYSCKKANDVTDYVIKIYLPPLKDHEVLNQRLSQLTKFSSYLRLPIETNQLPDAIGYYYEIYPLLQKGSLLDHVADITPEEIENHIIPQINEAIHLLHQQGIIHADIKPDNLYVNDQGKVILGDFGQAECFALDQGVNYRIANKKVRKGTLGFIPPEALHTTPGALTISVAYDYFLFGKTILDLYMKMEWLKNESAESQFAVNINEKQQFLPQEIPEHIKDLITMLTQPNSVDRIGYEGVKRWLKNPKHLYQAYRRHSQQRTIPLHPPFSFAEHAYEDFKALIQAMAEAPQLAKKLVHKEAFKDLFGILVDEKKAFIEEIYTLIKTPEKLLFALERTLNPPSFFRWGKQTFKDIQSLFDSLMNEFSLVSLTKEDFSLLSTYLRLQHDIPTTLNFIEQLKELANPVRAFDMAINIFGAQTGFIWNGQRYLSLTDFLRTCFPNQFNVQPLTVEDERILFSYIKLHLGKQDQMNLVHEVEKITNDHDRYFSLIYLFGNQESNDFYFSIDQTNIKTLSDLMAIIGASLTNQTKMNRVASQVFAFMMHDDFDTYAKHFLSSDQLKPMMKLIKTLKNQTDKDYGRALLWFSLNPNAPLILQKQPIHHFDELISYFDEERLAGQFQNILTQLKNPLIKAFCHARGYSYPSIL